MAKSRGDRLINVPDWFTEPAKRFPTVSSIVRKEFAGIAEAQAYAAGFSVYGSYGNSLSLANLVNEFLTQMQERGLPCPEGVIVAAMEFAAYGQRARLIPAKTVGRTIYINPSAGTWPDAAKSASDIYAARFWSTPHPLHPLYHEAGHVLLGTSEDIQRPLTPRQVTLAASVSSRAKQDGEEFVCEVFAGLFAGVEYDADIVRLYKRLGGKMP